MTGRGEMDMTGGALQEELIGYLDVTLAESGRSRGSSKNVVTVRQSEEIMIGRQENCTLSLPHPCCSAVHFRIYSIVFETKFPPLVYCEDLSRNGTLFNGRLIGKKKSVLLSDNDRLEIRCSAVFVFHSLKSRNFELPPLPQLAQDAYLFSEKYEVTDRLLGHGGYGTVHLARQKPTQKQLACKVLKLNSPTFKVSKSTLINEVKILIGLDHPNIIRVEEVYSNANQIFVFEELITGGDLWSYIEKKGQLEEVEALPIMWQVLEALIYLHHNGITHRDLKPDNILLASTQPGSRIILTDFGTAQKSNNRNRMKTYVGTVEYTAPEVTLCQGATSPGGYSNLADLWSFGNILYMVLRGHAVFAPEGTSDRKKVETRAAQCDLSSLDSKDWADATPEVKDLIRKLIVVDPTKRLDAKGVKKHPWLKRWRGILEMLYKKACRDWIPRVEPVRWVNIVETEFERRVTHNIGEFTETAEVIPLWGASHHPASKGITKSDSALQDQIKQINLSDDDYTEDGSSDDDDKHEKQSMIRLTGFDIADEDVEMADNSASEDGDDSELFEAVSWKEPGWKSAKTFALQIEEERKNLRMTCERKAGVHGIEKMLDTKQDALNKVAGMHCEFEGPKTRSRLLKLVKEREALLSRELTSY